MYQLKLSDVTHSAIAAREREAEAYDEQLAALTERGAAVDAQAESLRVRRDTIRKEVQWRKLMAEAEALDGGDRDGNNSGDALSLCEEIDMRVEAAVAAFHESLAEPTDYTKEATADSCDELVPYTDTDDYADLTVMESVVEEITDEVLQALTANAGAGQTCAHGRRVALLRLLLLSLSVGRLEELCGFADLVDPTAAPTSDADEIRESVAAIWQQVLGELGVLTPAEREEWAGIVADFLGPPFDAPPA